jgi:serine/threonine protein kinase
VHRDLKPENVLIRADRSAVLVDLGIAKWTKFELGGERDPLDALETPAELEGPDTTYAPPEALVEECYDELGDQWAWGVLGYELFTGKRPEADSPPLTSFEEIPKQIAAALDRARAAERDDRWDTLDIALQEIGPSSVPIQKVEPPPKASTKPPPEPEIEEAPPSPLAAPRESSGPSRALSPLVLGVGIALVLGIVIAVVATMR